MVRRGRLVAVEGGSASGKTTLVRVAGRTLGWRPLPEAFDRLDPAPSLEFDSARALLELEAALLSEEVRRYREARELCERGATVLADTGFLGPLTYTRGLVDLGLAPPAAYRRLAAEGRSLVQHGNLGIPDLTVYLRTTSTERSRRARRSIGRHPASVFPRHDAVGAVEQRFFGTEFPAVVPGRFRSLRANVPPATLGRRLRSIVEEGPETPSTPTDALAVLDALRLPSAGRTSAPTVKKPTRPAPLPRNGR